MRSLAALIVGAALMLSASTAFACGQASAVIFACGRTDTVLFVGTGGGVRPTVKLVPMDGEPAVPAWIRWHYENLK